MTDEVAAPGDGDNLRQRYETIEARRQHMLVYLGNSTAGIFLLGFGIDNYLHGRHALAAFTLFHALVVTCNIVLFRLTRNHHWASIGFGYGILAMSSYLMATGGVDQTGPLWTFPMVVAIISLLGPRHGLIVIGLMFCAAVLLFWFPLPQFAVAQYSPVFKFRFIAAFLALSLFTALHEYARARSQMELIRVSAQLDRLSHTDELTALPNRRYMIERLEAENSRHRRHQHPYSLLYGDVDGFKAINDIYGHQIGDAALQAIAGALRSALRHHDELSRWGGEEFLALLPETNARVAADVAEKLRAAVEDIRFEQGGRLIPLTMSFGVHTVTCHGKIDGFIHHADQKLYRAKKSGKNCVVGEPCIV